MAAHAADTIQGFQIIYNGPTLRDRLMSINDLALALLALSHLVEQVNYWLNSDNSPVLRQISTTKKYFQHRALR